MKLPIPVQLIILTGQQTNMDHIRLCPVRNAIKEFPSGRHELRRHGPYEMFWYCTRTELFAINTDLRTSSSSSSVNPQGHLS